MADVFFLTALRALTLSDHASDVPTAKWANSDQRLEATATKSQKTYFRVLKWSRKSAKLPAFFSLRLSRGFPSSIVELMKVFLVNSEDVLNEPGRLPLLRFLNVRRFVVVSLHNWHPCISRGNLEIRVIPRVLSHRSVRFSGKNYRRWKIPSCRGKAQAVVCSTNLLSGKLEKLRDTFYYFLRNFHHRSNIVNKCHQSRQTSLIFGSTHNKSRTTASGRLAWSKNDELA